MTMQIKTKYKPYSKYKPSGVDWIGEIPDGWEMRKIKYSAPSKKVKITNSDYQIALENIESFTGKFIATDNPFEGVGIAFDENSILYGKLRPYLCKVFLPEDKGLCVSEFLVMVPLDKIACKKFLFYYYLSYLFTDMINGATFGSKMPRADWRIVGNFKLTLPSLTEQQVIAKFLDRETARINEITAKQTQMIDLLMEKRSALITKVVTKGLDPNVKMKPSGVEWIGEIPVHWAVRRIKYAASIVLGKMINTTGGQGYFLKFYLKSRNIGWEKPILDSVDEMYFSKNELNQYRLQKNDLLVSEGGEVGKTSIWNNEIEECYIQNSVHKITVNSNLLLPQYLLSVFTSYGAGKVFPNIVNQVSIAHLTKDKLKIIPIPIPPLDEQKAIAAFLGFETEKIDTMISKIKKQIELLNEYKQSLINHVVTGKIDVRGEVA